MPSALHPPLLHWGHHYLYPCINSYQFLSTVRWKYHHFFPEIGDNAQYDLEPRMSNSVV